MMNVSNSTQAYLEPPIPYGETYWIISETFLIFVTLVDLYFFKSIICYLWKLRKKKNRGQLRVLLGLGLSAVVMAMGRFVANQAVAFLGWQTDELCFNSFAVSIVFYSASISPVYIFLWMRQHSFYTSKQMPTLNNNKIKCLSYACLFLLVVGWIVLTVVYLLPEVTGWEYAATQDGCKDKNDEQDFELLPILVNLFGGMGQLSLLGLLLYPLLKVKSNNKRMSVRKSSRNQQTKKKDKLHQVEDTSRRLDPNFTTNPGYISADEGSGYASDGDLTKFPSSKPASSAIYLSPKKTVVQKLQSEGASRSNRSSAASIKSIARKQHSGTPNRNEATPKKSRGERRREQRLKKLIEKVFFLALGCVCTDIVATVLQLLLVQPELVYLVIYDVNLIINIFCILLSFEKWKDILFGWRSSCKGKLKRRTSSMTSQLSLQTLTTKVDRFFTLSRRTRAMSSASSLPTSRPGSPVTQHRQQSEQTTFNSYSATSEM